jgi:hypothetical protein
MHQTSSIILCWTFFIILVLPIKGQKGSKKTKLSLVLDVSHFIGLVEDSPTASTPSIPSTTSSSSIAVGPTSLPNCTRCHVWNGDDCYDYKPCTFCNQTVPCTAEYLECRDNVCMEDTFSGKSAKNSKKTYLLLISPVSRLLF